eukprot:scaffold15740_cov108-Isochrysis_galbana.AAC.5
MRVDSAPLTRRCRIPPGEGQQAGGAGRESAGVRGRPGAEGVPKGGPLEGVPKGGPLERGRRNAASACEARGSPHTHVPKAAAAKSTRKASHVRPVSGAAEGGAAAGAERLAAGAVSGVSEAAEGGEACNTEGGQACDTKGRSTPAPPSPS